MVSVAHVLAACVQVPSGLGGEITEQMILPGTTFVVSAGSTLLFGPGGSVLAVDGGSIVIEGTEASPVFLRPTGSSWGGFTAAGSGSRITIRHAVIFGAPIVAKDGAELLIEDSILQGYLEAVPPIVYTSHAGSALVRRSIIRDFYELNFAFTAAVVEDCLLENMTGDGVDFDNSPAGASVVRTTIRNSAVPNVDGVDFGVVQYPWGNPSQGTVEDCRIYGVSDKGISVGELSAGVSVRRTLIHHVGTGVSAKDASRVALERVTVADSGVGLDLHEERPGYGGGLISGASMVVWGNQTVAVLVNGSSLALENSCVGGGWPGTGNIDLDPLFVDPERGLYSISPGSPAECMGAPAAVGPTWMAIQSFRDRQVPDPPSRTAWAGSAP